MRRRSPKPFMRILELPANKTVHIRETAKELPINRYTDFQKYLIQVAGLGSDMPGVDIHFGKLFRFLGAGMTEEASREAYNLYNNIFLAINKVDIDSVAFNCLVDSITHYKPDPDPKTGKLPIDYIETITDYSEAGLIALAGRLGEYGLTRLMVDDILQDVKKKSIRR